ARPRLRVMLIPASTPLTTTTTSSASGLTTSCRGISSTASSSTEFEIGPDRNVIRRLLPAAHVLVDADGDQPIGRLRRQQQMIDADAVVLLPGAGLVVPKRVRAGPVASGPDRVGQSEKGEGAEFLPRARQEQRVLHPAVGVAGIERGWNDIEVPTQDQRFFQLQPFVRIVNKSVHPADFV